MLLNSLKVYSFASSRHEGTLITLFILFCRLCIARVCYSTSKCYVVGILALVLLLIGVSMFTLIVNIVVIFVMTD